MPATYSVSGQRSHPQCHQPFSRQTHLELLLAPPVTHQFTTQTTCRRTLPLLTPDPLPRATAVLPVPLHPGLSGSAGAFCLLATAHGSPEAIEIPSSSPQP